MRHYLSTGKHIVVTDKMNGKMEGMWSLNTSPSINPFCLKMRKGKNTICKSCYSHISEARFKLSKAAWINNYHVLSEVVLKDRDIPLFNLNIFRLQAHGDLVNRIHYKNLIKIVEANPQSMFAMWSKNLPVIYKGGMIKLPNLIYVYSTPQLNEKYPTKPKGFDKVFTVYGRNYVKDNPIQINCALHCNSCRLCYRRGEPAFINELIKSNGHSGKSKAL
jgi:hypothetical protein